MKITSLSDFDGIITIESKDGRVSFHLKLKENETAFVPISATFFKKD